MLFDATAISAYLKNPRLFYWQYVYTLPGAKIAGIVPKEKSQQRFDHELVFGTIWAQFVADFYAEKADEIVMLDRLVSKTIGWVEPKVVAEQSKAMSALMAYYRLNFRPDDGARTQSEIEFVDGDFCGRVDGYNRDFIIHECKATRRKGNLPDMHWMYLNSIQVKLYLVALEANGVMMEYAFKDYPYTAWRTPVYPVSDAQRVNWGWQLRQIREAIDKMTRETEDDGVEPLCNPDGCCIVGKSASWMCPYKELCDGNMAALARFKPREEHLESRK